MLIKTRHFGEVDLDDNKIIYFDNGLFGFEEYKEYVILFNNEENDEPHTISWLQSADEPSLALPIISPYILDANYNPEVDDEELYNLGDLLDNNTVVLAIVTVPEDIENISANLKAPIIINTDTKKGCQIIVLNQEYEIKHYFYNLLQNIKEKKGANKC